MNPATGQPSHLAADKRVQCIGCVGFLNSKPLIEGLEGNADPAVRLDVPAALLTDLEHSEVDIALCPVIDYYLSTEPLVIVPVGCIASDGPTQTVRLFSRAPIERITQVHADVDSHTSVMLLRVLLDELHGLHPKVVPYDALQDAAQGKCAATHEAMLLIGDKVVTNAPPAEAYPYQMDLGQAWKQLTGLPFVFAVWMAKRDSELGNLPTILNRQRELNTQRTEVIADRHATRHGWDIADARNYLGKVLTYNVGSRELQAIEQFANKAARLGLIDPTRGAIPSVLYNVKA